MTNCAITITEMNLTHANYDCIKYIPPIKVTKLNCHCNLITDNELRLFPDLKELYCYTTGEITDLGLSFLPHLTVLYLGSETKITDHGLSFVPNLKQLFINDNQGNITNLGIQSLHELEMLHCGDNTEIDDVGGNIRVLSYTNNHFSKNTLKKLQLPYTLVINDNGHIIAAYSDLDELFDRGKGIMSFIYYLLGIRV